MCWEARSDGSMPSERCVLTRRGRGGFIVCDHFRLRPSGASRQEAVGSIVSRRKVLACIVVAIGRRVLAGANTIVSIFWRRW
jgi:hypothetical protein